MRVKDTEVNTARSAAVIAAYGGSIEIINCSGSDAPIGHYAYGNSVIGGMGTGVYATTQKKSDYGGQIDVTWTAKTGKYSPITIVQKTQTWNSNGSDSWNEGDGWYSTNDDVLQGKWSGYGPYRGLWFFGTGVRNTVNGKTIKKIRVYVTRQNKSGTSAGVVIGFSSAWLRK